MVHQANDGPRLTMATVLGDVSGRGLIQTTCCVCLYRGVINEKHGVIIGLQSNEMMCVGVFGGSSCPICVSFMPDLARFGCGGSL
jgi:hypothetical protein